MKINATPTLVILAGGLATRLYPITKSIPKSMINVNGKPFINHQLKMLSQKGVSRIVFCVGHLGDQIKNYIAENETYGIEIVFSEDGDKLCGTGGALIKALQYVDDTFMVTYGDSYLDIDYQNIAHEFNNSSKTAMMTVFKNDNMWDKSNVHFNDGKIKHYSKTNLHPKMQHIDFGLLIFKKETVMPWKNFKQFDLSEILKTLVNNDNLHGFEVFQRFYEVGTHQGIVDLESYLSD